tara:strand:+ start:2977 stop:3114 length:138 start_codon:yes stop_codon:yes gene_type:complete
MPSPEPLQAEVPRKAFACYSSARQAQQKDKAAAIAMGTKKVATLN